MLDVISVTLQGIGYAMFDLTFILGVWLIFLMLRKLNLLDFYRAVPKRPNLYLMSDLLIQGIIAGVIASVVMVVVGVPLYFNYMIMIMIPISLVLGIKRLRFMCISYGASLLAFLSLVFNGQTIGTYTLPFVEIHIPSVLILVGLLHLIEGVLVFLFAAKRAVPVISKKDNQVVMGHIIQKTWIVPLSVLALTIGTAAPGGIEMPDWWPLMEYTGYGSEIFFTVFPLLGFMNYTTITYCETPKQRSRFSGSLIAVYGVVLIFLGRIAIGNVMVEFLGALLMLVLHEAVYWLEKYREDSREAVYSVPAFGVRIMEVLDTGLAKKVGVKKGEVIKAIDGELIKNISHFVRVVRAHKSYDTITILDVRGNVRDIDMKELKGFEHLGVRILPDKPLFLYPYDKLSYMGLYDFIAPKETLFGNKGK